MEYEDVENCVIKPLGHLCIKPPEIDGHIISKDESEYSDSDQFDQNICFNKNNIKKNRRKSTVPQKAAQTQLEMYNTENGSTEAITDSLQDKQIVSTGNYIQQREQEKGEYSEKYELLEENLFNLDKDILFTLKQHDMFKDPQFESDYSQDTEITNGIKDNWKDHWGIKCNMCEEVYAVKADFDKHYTLNYSTYPIYTCVYCAKSFPKYATLRSHCYRHMTDDRFRCKECSKCFRHQNSLQLHMMTKHENIKPFLCKECGKEFATKPGLNIHLKKHKIAVKEDYPCMECGKILHTRGGLTSHMNVHRLGRRFMCDLCGKTFTQKVNMMQHVRQHTGDKPYACDKCDKTFTERSHLARHYSFHSDKRPFKCQICQKMYKTERCLKVHSLVHAAERPFVCTVCNKGFLSTTKLKQHSNIHTGERPFKCKYCERTFTNYPNWLKHIRRRHKVDHKTGAKLPQEEKQIKQPKVIAEIKLEVDVDRTQLKPELNPDLNQESSNNCNVPSAMPSTLARKEFEPKLPDNSQVSDSLSLMTDNLINDYNLAKAEEMFLKQGILNFPILDDRININQSSEIFPVNTTTSGINHYIVPYSLPPSGVPNQTLISTGSHNIVTVPFQLNEFIAPNFVEQSCD